MAEATKTEAAAKKGEAASKNGQGGEKASGLSKDVLLGLLSDMLLYRRFEGRAEEAYAIGKIGVVSFNKTIPSKISIVTKTRPPHQVIPKGIRTKIRVFF